MLNVVALTGRLVADPQLRQTETGRKVASLRIACDRSYQDASGNRSADFLDVIAWEKTGEFICRNFSKGDLLSVTGRLQSRTYRDRSGANRHVVEVVANTADFSGPRSANTSTAPYGANNAQDVPPIQDEGNLPF